MCGKTQETVASLLKEENADFVGLQEVVYPQLQDLVEALKGYDHIGVGRKDGKTKGEYSPIFYQKKKYKLLESNTFWLIKPRRPFPKVGMPLWNASVSHSCSKPNDQEKIWVFNTHLITEEWWQRAKSIDLITKR